MYGLRSHGVFLGRTGYIYIYIIYIYINPVRPTYHTCTCLRSPYGLRSHGVFLGRTGYIYSV